MLSAWGIGALAGSGLFLRVGHVHLGRLIVGSTVAVAIGYALMGLAPTLAVACVGSALGGIGNGVQWVSVMTALQETVGDAFQARAAGLLEAASDAIPAVGFALGGILTAVASPRVAYAVAAGGATVVVIAWLRRPIVPRETTADPVRDHVA
jgi:MFS family permease